MYRILILLFTLGVSTGYGQSKKTVKHFDKGLTFSENKEYKKAISAYLDCIEEDPTQSSCYLNAGIDYSSIGEYERSIEMLEKAMNIDPASYKICTSLGNSFSHVGAYKKAIYYLGQAIDLKEDGLDTLYFNIGNNYMRWGKLDSAVWYYEKGLDLNPESGVIRTNLAYVLILQEDYLAAKPELKILIKDFPKVANNYNNLGYVFYQLNELKSAEYYVNKSLEIDDENSWCYRNLGLIYKKKGEQKKACKYLNRALDLDFVKIWGEDEIKDLIKYCP